MSQIGRKDASEAYAAQETAVSRAEEAGPVTTEAEMAPLRAALRGLLAEGLPAEAVEDALRRLLARLRVGVEQQRPNKQLAPWMAGVARRVVDSYRGRGDDLPSGEDRIAAALEPLVDTLAHEHAEVLLLTDHGPLTQLQAAGQLGVSLVTLKSRVHTARRRLRTLVLAGLNLWTPDIANPDDPPSPDTRPARRRTPVTTLRPAFIAGLEQLVRPWVHEADLPAAVQAVVDRLTKDLAGPALPSRLPAWIYTAARETILAAPWATSSPGSVPVLPPRPTTEARAIFAPVLLRLADHAHPDQLRALRLVDLDGQSQRDAARQLGILPETFKQRLWRARRESWSTLLSALGSSRRPEPTTPTIDTLITALQDLIQHLAPNTPPTPVVQGILRQLHASAGDQRPSSSLVLYLYDLARAALQPRPTASFSAPPPAPDTAGRAALHALLAPLLAILTPDQLSAFTLVDLNHLSLESAAAQTNIDRPTLQGRLQRARIRLRALARAVTTTTPR